MRSSCCYRDSLLAPRLSHPPGAPEPTGQAVLGWAAGEAFSQPCWARAALAPGSELLNEVLSFPSWEWENARCRFLMLLFYFAAASPSRCLNVTDYFSAVRARDGESQEGEVKNLASASQTAGIPDTPAAAQKPGAGRDGEASSPFGKQEPRTGQ